MLSDIIGQCASIIPQRPSCEPGPGQAFFLIKARFWPPLLLVWGPGPGVCRCNRPCGNKAELNECKNESGSGSGATRSRSRPNSAWPPRRCVGRLSLSSAQTLQPLLQRASQSERSVRRSFITLPGRTSRMSTSPRRDVAQHHSVPRSSLPVTD